MTRVRTVDFLPEIFQTPANKQFLAATLDQLVQEPKYKKTQGWIGRRVGPGVNPNDHYVVEPTKTRENYQLEPGVVLLDSSDSHKVVDAITYPGINDAISSQGGFTDNAQRLYTSEYYSFDPFIDYDKFVNYSQYYWLPYGPSAVTVAATDVPTSNDFTVTRDNGYYTFSSVGDKNPNITLVRGGTYNFEIAQNETNTVTYRVTNNGTSAYVIDFQPNPDLTLVRGNTYIFNLVLNSSSLPFWIKTQLSTGFSYQYSAGVFNNGATQGQVKFTVPMGAPDTLYYCCGTEVNMQGTLNIVDPTPGTGPDFWIQAAPGVDGRMPATPNISSRDVYGVTNNGIDLGTLTFNAPFANAQQFYYDLNDIGTVDLLTTLQFDQIDGMSVEQFVKTYGGIDDITNLDNRTLVFLSQDNNPVTGGWQINSPFDPLPRNSSYNGVTGSYDTTDYAFVTDITDPNIQYGIWQVNYVPDANGVLFIQLTSVGAIAVDDKFTVRFGTQYASTSWYKDTDGFFHQIPLLTAAQNILYYQDGLDPDMWGTITLIEGDLTATLDISQILGRKNYTSPNGVVFTNGLKVVFRGNTLPKSYENVEYYVEGVGTAIQLLPVSNYLTPETYTADFSIPYDTTPYDTTPYDASIYTPFKPDYLTINRASPDLNPWSRSNRWFHSQVIAASAAYNGIQPVYDTTMRGRRSILEYRGGTRLFNFGTKGLAPVTVFDFTQTNALLNVNGQSSYITNGFTLRDGDTVIFAADTDVNVRKTVYKVTFIIPDTVPPLIAEPYINLVPVTEAKVDDTAVCMFGTGHGKSYNFDGINWTESQQKTKVNQAPLFDVFDSNGVSFADKVVYPSSTFVGSKLFSYAVGSGTNDTVLGFPLSYFDIGVVGDILFDNNLYTDTFTYVVNNSGVNKKVSDGFVRQYADRTVYTTELGWQTAICKSQVRQQFQFVYDGSPYLYLDIAVGTTTQLPAVQIFVGTNFQLVNTYSYTTTANTTTISLLDTSNYAIGDVIEVAVLSDQVSKKAFYQVPQNLENNPFNGNSPQFTQGAIRMHYDTIAENLTSLVGPINGANNIRDLGNVVPFGQMILQQSSPLTLAGYFYRSEQFNIFNSLIFNSREYTKFKNQLLYTVVNSDYGMMTIPEILDTAIAQINAGRTNLSPFYWSDMLPSGTPFASNSYTVTPITQPTFNTVQTYSFTDANYRALLVYQNDKLLVRGADYTVPPDTAKVTLTVQLNHGDVITIVEYNNTAGNFVPNTPSKMGMWSAYEPEIFLNPNYITPSLAIRGHDGSVTVAFGDFRDEILLEFEKRIYNNIKMDGNPNPLPAVEVIPGFFRSTDYTHAEIQELLNEEFMTWVGWNKIDYQKQDFLQDEPFSYNYSCANDKINGEVLPGAWRGINNYFYDTLDPNLRPWEMLGFSVEPDWWTDVYGPSPWTSGNTVLWDDLQAGYVADPAGGYYKPEYARPQLTRVIPNGTSGQLLPPIQSVVGQYDPTGFKKSWVPGDGGPTEASWYTSSAYAFSVMRILALTRPAEFFSLYVDRDAYRYDATIGQYLYNGRYRMDAKNLTLYGSGTSTASYINWIIDYNQQLGVNSSTALQTSLTNLDVRLCYRMASFTELSNLKVTLERSSPQSNNQSLQIPQNDLNLILYENQPHDATAYSALVIQIVPGGYAVYGYSNDRPYFPIRVSQPSGVLKQIQAGNTTVSVPAKYTDVIGRVPYGTVFATPTIVVDFILSYGKYLQDQGFVFEDVGNGYVLSWEQMAQEFLYFTIQGWGNDTILNLNPSASGLTCNKPGSVVTAIESITPENMILDQNRQVLATRNLNIERYGDQFTAAPTAQTQQTISYLNLKFTDYEDLIVFNNMTVFQDLVYDPVTSLRQARMKLSAITSTEWNGTLDAQGFILNQNNVKQWDKNTRYTKGDIVLYKNLYWQALDFVQPSEKFDLSKWTSSNYTRVQEGLLPNLANKADQLVDAYNTMNANLDNDESLLAYNLIGFNPRQYMAAIDLDDPSQVSLYQNFIPYVGTPLAAELFSSVQLNRFKGDYKINENWAIQSGTYGANANKSFVELQLNQSLLKNNPSTVQVSTSQSTSQANQVIAPNQLWSESYFFNNTDFLPTIYPTRLTTGLPSAGYVSFDDVDVTVFSFDNPSSIEQHINDIGVGTIIWVAKSNSYDWNVYRCQDVKGQLTTVSDNLNGTSIATFNADHGLSRGDLVIIKYFNSSVNGVYRVLATPTPNTMTISYQFNNTNQTTISGQGLVFFLQTARVKQASDAASLPYVNQLGKKAKVWVDNNGSGHWEVIEKQDTFVEVNTVPVSPQVAYSEYGKDVAQSYNHLAALAGAPGINTTGALYTFTRDEQNSYVYGPLLYLGATGTLNYGCSVNFGYQNWAAAGASLSNSGAGYAASLYLSSTGEFAQTQLLMADDLDFTAINFGACVDISQDERWLYVGAPGGNKVYAYGRVDVQIQTCGYKADGTTTSFNYSDNIVIDFTEPLQLMVSVDDVDITGNGSYTVGASNVIFTVAPAADSIVKFARRQDKTLDLARYSGITQNSTSGSGSGAQFEVENRRGVYSAEIYNDIGGTGYLIGDTVTIDYTQIDPTGSAANNLVMTVVAVGPSGELLAFTFSGSGTSTTSTFDLGTYLYTADTIHSFTVFVNRKIQRPYLDYTFNTITKQFTFQAGSIPTAGDLIQVSASVYWKPAGVITVGGLSVGAQFGASLSTDIDGSRLVVGAPYNDNGALTAAGSAFVFSRESQDFVVSNTSTMTYTVLGVATEPVNVQLNNTFLLNVDQTPLNKAQYSFSGNTLTLMNITLNYGDIIRVETNQFRLVQTLEANDPQEYSLFGSAVTIDWEGTSIYVGQPQDSSSLIQSGSVTRFVDQAQLYGSITTTIANPTLVAGQTIRVNSVEVAVPAAPNNTVAGLVSAINSSNVPNALAVSTPDMSFTGNGQTRVFDIGTMYSAAASYTTMVYLNDILLTDGVQYTYNNTTGQITFTTAPIYGDTVKVISGRMTVSVINPKAAMPGELVSVLPGITGTVWTDMGFVLCPSVQTIRSPYETDYAHFGESVDVDTNGINLVVGAPNGNVYEPMTFDDDTTYFDEHSTTFYSPIVNSGVVYTYNFLPSAVTNISNPGLFVFGQQIYDKQMSTSSRFGFSANYTNNRLVIGAPGNEQTTGSTAIYGRMTVFKNPGNLPAWNVIHQQQPVVDIYNLESVYTYSNLTPGGTQTYFDFFDPLQGKILGVARRNIDYIGSVDPAQYNVGPIHNNGNSWAFEHVGEIWWDTDTVRFVNPNQDDINYASKQWGQTFPGSRVDIYQWVESEVSPADYTGPGIVLSAVTYTTNTRLDQNGILQTFYYFWVRGLTITNVGAGKTLSTSTIANYIANPLASGIPYIAPINASTVAVYNAGSLLSAMNTILHIGFDKQLTDANVHVQYEIITDGKKKSFLSDSLYLKLIDSFSGINEVGYNVPDISLPLAMQQGTSFRPRQSMFYNRFAALENYLNFVNGILAEYPIVEMRSFELLNAKESPPPAGSGAWDKQVANLTELSYQDIYAVALGYKYLVDTDSSYDGEWTIYQVVLNSFDPTIRELSLAQIQSFDVALYWSYINWYAVGFDSSTRPYMKVANRSALIPLTWLPAGTVVEVQNNGSNAWELYQKTVLDTWDRVGLQNGTIAFDSSLWDYAAAGFGYAADVYNGGRYDESPQTETRYIIRSINEQLFTNELEIYRNQALILMFQYIFTEQKAPYWLTKTSLVDVGHNISYLRPYQIYDQGNQYFVLDYLNEVKPYHVVIRNFDLIYNGEEFYNIGRATDFDCPAYWNTTLPVPQYTSPVLTPYTRSNSTVENFNSDLPPGNELWSVAPWSDWYDNYTLGITDIVIQDGGSGYYVEPEVIVTGTCTVPASLTAVINSAGQVTGVWINNPGSGYTTTPTITFSGTIGSGAKGIAVMGNKLVRSFNVSLKFDRYQYQSTLVDWAQGVSYPVGSQVRHLNAAWQANTLTDASIFDFSQWNQIPAGDLSGVDRTFAYYTPTTNMAGQNLALVMTGIDYPGVQVYGNLYDSTIELDAIYQGSTYLDTYLGVLASDVEVVGSGYINTFAAHAPEELLPGYTYDTLDMRVYTRSGGDWIGFGNGWPQVEVQSVFTGPAISYANAMKYPVQIMVTNKTTGQELAASEFTVDWVAQDVTVTSGAVNGDTVVVAVYGLGGGNQLYQAAYNGADVNSGVVIPVAAAEIDELAIFANGVQDTSYTITDLGTIPSTSLVTFGTVYGATDAIVLVAIGLTYPQHPGPGYQYSWSTPLTQEIVSTGAASYPLTNSVMYTNPVNPVVTVNGLRVRTPATAYYVADGTTKVYELPTRLGPVQPLITGSEVAVYVDSVLQTPVTDYYLNPSAPPAARAVTFLNPPPADAVVLVTTSIDCDATIVGTDVVFSAGSIPAVGDIINVTTWNDTREQNIVTQVFVGPLEGTQYIVQGYSTTLYSPATVNNTLGSYDYSGELPTISNSLFLSTPVTDPDRLWVTLNGKRIYENAGYKLQGNEVILTSGILAPTDVVMITEYTDSVVPEAYAFRIFQDMRGEQVVYRITPQTTTKLVAPLSATDDIIYVEDAYALQAPDINQNQWGVLTVNGERIMYRDIDYTLNTVNSLLRGTAGTAAADHVTDTPVYNMGPDNMLPKQYQNYVQQTTTRGDDTTVSFTAVNVNLGP